MEPRQLADELEVAEIELVNGEMGVRISDMSNDVVLRRAEAETLGKWILTWLQETKVENRWNR